MNTRCIQIPVTLRRPSALVVAAASIGVGIAAGLWSAPGSMPREGAVATAGATLVSRQETRPEGAREAGPEAGPEARAPGRDRARDGQDSERGGRRGGRGMPLPPDWPRAGGFGPGAAGLERPMIEGLVIEGLLPATFARRELTDDDVARVVAVAKEVSPEWGAAIEARVEQDAAQVKSSLRTSGRRLLGLVALKERAPVVFAAKVAELRAQAETDRAATELREAEAQADSSTDSSTDSPAAGAAERGPGIETLREALAAASARQVDATLAARRAELDALEERLAKLRSDLEADRGRRADMAAEVAKRAQNRGDDARAPRREPGRE